MAMMGPAAESPDAYIDALSGWQRKRWETLCKLEPRIKASGEYELGKLVMTETTDVAPDTIATLAAEAFRLNAALGNPAART